MAICMNRPTTLTTRMLQAEPMRLSTMRSKPLGKPLGEV
jgi:hypothetical protein